MRASGDAWPSDPGFEPRRLRDSYPTVGPQDSQHLTRPHLSNLRFACQGTVEVVRHVRLWAPPSPARVIQRAGEGGSHADTTTRAARPPADEMGATAAATRAGAGSFWSGTHLAARGCRSLPRSRSPTTFPRHRPNSRGCRPGRSPPRRCRVTVPPLRSNIPPAASHSRSLGDAAKAGAAPKRHTTVIAVVARARFMSVPP